MNSFKISKGHNIKLPGVPAESIKVSDNPDIVIFHPSSIKNIKTKLMSIPRRFLFKFSADLAARLLWSFSLFVLAK